MSDDCEELKVSDSCKKCGDLLKKDKDSALAKYYCKKCLRE